MNDSPSAIRIRYHNPHASSVALAGDFNGWAQQPLLPVGNGWWHGFSPNFDLLEWTPYRVRYKLVIDGTHWIRDPANELEVAGDSAIECLPRRPVPNYYSGRVEECWFYSSALGYRKRYLAWIPPNEPTHSAVLPTVYLLHGYHDGGEYDFLVKGRVDQLAAQLLALGRIQPMLLIMPDGEESFYADRHDGSKRYEHYMTHELLRDVEQRFQTGGGRKRRGIGGLSMGGLGAVKLALQYPHLYSSVAAHAGIYDVRRPDILPEIFGTGAHYDRHRQWNSPVWLVQESHRTQELNLHFDCGDQDALLKSSYALRDALEQYGHPSLHYRFAFVSGHHTWDYVQRQLPDALEWHSHHLIG